MPRDFVDHEYLNHFIIGLFVTLTNSSIGKGKLEAGLDKIIAEMETGHDFEEPLRVTGQWS
jgi:hypothetical protein